MKKISRKSFITGGAASMVTGGVLLSGCKDKKNTSGEAPAFDPGKRFKWNMVTAWPPNFPIIGDGCRLFSEWIDQMSGGRLQIRVFGGGELIPALEAFDAVSSGTAQIGHGSGYYWAGKVPAAQFFSSVPFGMNAQQINAWIYSGGGLELWRELYEPFNLIPFVAGNTTAQMGGWFNREINSVADLRGLKMRIPGLGGRVFEKLGGTAVLSAGSEIYTNLERGVIDATEWIGPYHDYKMGFHKIAKYYYSPGWHESGTALEIFVNRDYFQELTQDLQVILETACARLNLYIMTELEVKNSEYLDIMTKEGVEIRTFPSELLAETKKMTRSVLGEITAQNPAMDKIYKAFLEFKEKNSAWSAISEKIFYSEIS